jgi:hypothetical protein
MAPIQDQEYDFLLKPLVSLHKNVCTIYTQAIKLAWKRSTVHKTFSKPHMPPGS